jgi:hypothetical protein
MLNWARENVPGYAALEEKGQRLREERDAMQAELLRLKEEIQRLDVELNAPER